MRECVMNIVQVLRIFHVVLGDTENNDIGYIDKLILSCSMIQ